jgi:hypothetical protein
MRFNDLPANCEPYTSARIFSLTVEPFEWQKNTFCVLWVEADAVVADLEHPLVFSACNRNVDAGSLRSSILHAICKQVLKYSGEL